MVRAKFTVISIEEFVGCRVVKLAAVYSSDSKSPNYTWSKATPTGKLEMTITNPAAYTQFAVGREYFLEVTPDTIPEVLKAAV